MQAEFLRGEEAAMGKRDARCAQQRERFRATGLQGMTDQEALELLLSYAVPGDTEAVAYRLLKRFGSLSGVFGADEGALRGVEGVSESTALLMLSLVPLWQRMNLSAPCENVLQDGNRIGDYFCAVFSGVRREQIFAAAVDGTGKLLACRCLREGSSGAVDLDLSALAEFASGLNASYVVLAHNHPSGVATPSRADIDTTYRVVAALAPYHICLLDHIIVADNDFVSMRQSGVLDADARAFAARQPKK